MCVTYYHWNIIFAHLIWFVPKWYCFISWQFQNATSLTHLWRSVNGLPFPCRFAYTASCAATLFFFLLCIGLWFLLPVTLPHIRRRSRRKADRSEQKSRARGTTQHTRPTTVPVAMADGRESDFVQPIDTQNCSSSVRCPIDSFCLSLSVISGIRYPAPDSQTYIAFKSRAALPLKYWNEFGPELPIVSCKNTLYSPSSI